MKEDESNNIDIKLDIKIINEFCKLKKNENATSWKIMKKIYPKGQNCEHMRIIRHIKKMSNYGLFLVTKNGDNHEEYLRIKENSRAGEFEFPDKDSDGIGLKIENKWIIFQT